MPTSTLVRDTPELARQYEQVSADWQFRDGRVLLDALALKPGEHVLDIGTGTGLVAACAADRVGAAGMVTGIDPLPLRIDIANAKARPNLRFQVGNAYDLGEFPPAHFDVVYLNAVFHWLEDKLESLRQIHRVLKPGGRLGISTGCKDHPNLLQEALRAVFVRAPFAQHVGATAASLYRVNGAETEALLHTVGFSVQTLELKPNDNWYASAEAAMQFSQASAFGNFLSHLPQDLQKQAYAEAVIELERYRTAQGIPQGGSRVVVVARRRP